LKSNSEMNFLFRGPTGAGAARYLMIPSPMMPMMIR